MPEYLAPSVYVEETSFRAKSIEGVSTSTTAFIGPTRKGPLKEVPELITSYVDFERVYGGFTNLGYIQNNDANNKTAAPNYIAHAVKNYFDNGGARLYVARVFNKANAADGFARSTVFNPLGDNTKTMQAVSRFPGESANGKVILQKATVPARTAQSAPTGSALLIKELNAGPAQLVAANKPPYLLADGDKLQLDANGVTVDITFSGKPAEATAGVAMGDTVDTSGNDSITINFSDSVSTAQTISLPSDVAVPRAEIVDRINADLIDGYARLDENFFLIIGTEVKGNNAYVKVTENTAVGFDSDVTEQNAADADNNVPNLNTVTITDIQSLFTDGGLPLLAYPEPSTNNMVFETTDKGAGVTLQVDGSDDKSVHTKMGLATDEVEGSPAASNVVYVKAAGGWFSGANKLILPAPANAELITLNIITEDQGGHQDFYEGIGFDRNHNRFLGEVFHISPARRADAIEHLFAIEISNNVTATDIVQMLFASSDEHVFVLTNGNDGVEPVAGTYRDAPDGKSKSPFEYLTGIEDISIVAAPGYSSFVDVKGIQEELVGHVERRRAYRVAVLDTPKDNTINQARDVKATIDSTYASLYYPWVITSDPVSTTPREIVLPPSGFVCGIYARNDISRGVSKSPGNEIVRGAIRFENNVNFAEQELLNPLGVNCLRFFPGRGHRLWGARTTSSDPEWKYIGPRRYFVYLEHSIDRSTQWAVFENNGPHLWANVRETVGNFLYNEWRSGSLLGVNPDEAYFVKCDRSTMTQNDLDNGRMICLIGVSVLKPAEFVIFRIGQKTADARA